MYRNSRNRTKSASSQKAKIDQTGQQKAGCKLKLQSICRDFKGKLPNFYRSHKMWDTHSCPCLHPLQAATPINFVRSAGVWTTYFFFRLIIWGKNSSVETEDLIIVKNDSEGRDFYATKEMRIRKLFLNSYNTSENAEKNALCCVCVFFLFADFSPLFTDHNFK